MYPTLNDYVNRGPIHPEAFYSLNIDINFEKKKKLSGICDSRLAVGSTMSMHSRENISLR